MVDVRSGDARGRQRRWRSLVLVCVAVALAGGAGCRKSAEQLAREARQRQAREAEKQRASEAERANAARILRAGQVYRERRQYAKAVERFERAEKLDAGLGLKVYLAKNNMAQAMLEDAHNLMDYGHVEQARQILQLLQGHFVKKYQEAAAKAGVKLASLEKGWSQLAEAKRLIDAYQVAAALEICRKIVEKYPNTHLADEATALLLQFGQ